MLLFSPFHPIIFVAVLLSLPCFYLLGALFTPQLSTPWRNISARAAMGALVFTFLMAVVHAGFYTLLLPFGIVLFISFQPKPKELFGYIKAIRLKHWAAALGCIICVLLFEMTINDIRIGDEIFIGNWDYANSGGFGFEYCITKTEGSRFIFDYKNNRAFHHFADHWLAGFYSQYLKMLPYYSYIIIYRAIGEILLMGLFVSWAMPLVNNKKWVALIAALVMPLVTGLQHLPFFDVLEKSIGFAVCNDTLWNCAPYFLLAIAVLLFSLWIAEGFFMAGMAGLLLLPVIHPGAMLMGPIAVVFLMLLKHFVKPGFPLFNSPLLLLVSVLPYLYAVIDGRMYSPDAAKIISGGFLYEVMQTILRLLLSVVALAPFIWGVWLLSKRTSTMLFWIHAGLFLGMVGSYAVVYNLLKGDSEQLFILYVTAILIPAGFIGIVAGCFAAIKWQRTISVIAIATCILSTAFNLEYYKNGNTVKQTLRNMLGYDEEWMTKSKMTAREAQQLIEKLNRDELTDVCIALNPDYDYHENGFMIHHSFLRGIIAGAEFHRINMLPVDTQFVDDMPRYAFFKRSNLNHCYLNNKSGTGVAQCMVNIIQPKYILLDTVYPKLFVPDELRGSFTHYDTLGRFILVSKPKDELLKK